MPICVHIIMQTQISLAIKTQWSSFIDLAILKTQYGHVCTLQSSTLLSQAKNKRIQFSSLHVRSCTCPRQRGACDLTICWHEGPGGSQVCWPASGGDALDLLPQGSKDGKLDILYPDELLPTDLSENIWRALVRRGIFHPSVCQMQPDDAF